MSKRIYHGVTEEQINIHHVDTETRRKCLLKS